MKEKTTPNKAPMIGPQSVYEAAEAYTKAPESLSSDTRTILGHVYRDYKDIEDKSIPFAEYALGRWKEGTFPMDALI